MSDLCSICGQSTSRTIRGICGGCLAASLLEDDTDESLPEESGGLEGFSVPGHRVLEMIARGGMGVVYRAQQERPKREVALKMLAAHGASEEMRERFLLEAKTLAALDHPGLLPVYQSGEVSGTPYFTMKLARGGTLAQRLASYRGEWGKVAELMATLAEAVAFAHEHGVLHRDIKPGNVLFDVDDISKQERAYITDFGLAKVNSDDSDLTRTISVLGTPHYMSPEVASKGAAAATTSSDSYALGAVLYELLAQRRPYESESIPMLLRRIVEEDPAPLPEGVPSDLAVITRYALNRDPQKRYVSTRDLAQDLQAWLDKKPIKARPETWWELTRRWVQRHPAASLAAVLVMIGIVAGFWLQQKATLALEQEKDIALAAQVAAVRASGGMEGRDEALAAAKSISAHADSRVRDTLRTDAITLLARPRWAYRDTLPLQNSEEIPIDNEHRFAVEHDGKTLQFISLEGDKAPERSSPAPGSIRIVVWLTSGAKKVLVQHHDASFALYDSERKSWAQPWPSHLWSMRLSPDESSVVYGRSDDNEIVIEEIGTRKEKSRIKTRAKQPRPLAFSPDGRSVVVANDETSEIEIYDLVTQQIGYNISVPWRKEFPIRASWRLNSSVLAVTSDTTDFLVIHANKKVFLRERFSGHTMEVFDVACSPQEEWLASCSLDGSVRLWEMITKREIARIHYPSPSRVKFSKDGKSLVIFEQQNGRLHRYRFDTPKSVFQCHIPRGSGDLTRQRPAWGVALASDDQLAVIPASFGLSFVDIARGRFVGHVDGPYFWEAASDPFSNGVLLAGDLGIFRLPLTPVQTEDQRAWIVGAKVPLITDPVHRLSVSKECSQMAYSKTKEDVALVEMDGEGNPKGLGAVAPTVRSMNAVALSPNGKWLVSTPHQIKENKGLIWSTSDLSKPLLSLPVSSERVFCLFSPDSRLLYIHSKARLEALDTQTWQPRWTVAKTESSYDNFLLSLSADGQVLAATVPPQGVALFDARTGRKWATLRHPDDRGVGAMQLSRNGSRLVMTGSMASVLCWDIASLRKELGALGLDWEAPPFPDEPTPLPFAILQPASGN